MATCRHSQLLAMPHQQADNFGNLSDDSGGARCSLCCSLCDFKLPCFRARMISQPFWIKNAKLDDWEPCCQSRSWTCCWIFWRSHRSPSRRLLRVSIGALPNRINSRLVVSFACSSRIICWRRHNAWLASIFCMIYTEMKGKRQHRLFPWSWR